MCRSRRKDTAYLHPAPSQLLQHEDQPRGARFCQQENLSADGFLESEKWGADTAEASKAAALKGMKEMSRVYNDKRERLYLPEG